MTARAVFVWAGTVLAVLMSAGTTVAQSTSASAPLIITRARGPIVMDGDLSDEGWRGVTPVERWYETQPGDNTEPKVRNVGYLAYDEKFFYAAFEFEDPDPSAMRAPYSDRDNIGNGQNDYGGILLDTRNTGSTGVFFVVSPRNVQYDSITDDASGENSAPDFFWDSATRVTAHGWTLEMRIPFSSLRYRQVDPQTWRIFLYRNYPRDRHYQFYSNRIPRDSNCFVCNTSALHGLEHLPGGGHIVVAPYLSGSNLAQPSGALGTPLVSRPIEAHAGLDVKYLPDADNAIDLTLKPDFSQVESDTAQIATNQRFALFFQEKRPFFLEGVDLLATPIQPVYTRTITAPDAGARVTGKAAGLRYTVLVANDTGGGSAVIPGPTTLDTVTTVRCRTSAGSSGRIGSSLSRCLMPSNVRPMNRCRLAIVLALAGVPASAQWLHRPTPGIPQRADGRSNPRHRPVLKPTYNSAAGKGRPTQQFRRESEKLCV